MKVEDELRYLASLKGMKNKAINKEIDYWLDRFDIEQNRKRKLNHYQKVINKNSIISKYVTQTRIINIR